MINFTPHRSLFLVLTLVVLTLACAIPGLGDDQVATTGSSGPAVTISSPAAGQSLEPGREVQVLSTSLDAAGVARTELLVDGEVVWVDANAEPEPDTPFVVAQPWVPELPGSHVIQVRSYNVDNVAGQSEPLPVTVIASAQSAAEEEPPGSPEQPELPTPTATPVATLADVPTATPAELLPTFTPTLPVATTTPAPPTPTPTATPTPGTFEPTGLKPEGRFKEIWQLLGAGDSRLGYPLTAEISDRDFARQYFEKGLMFWWDNPDDPDTIWVLDSVKTDLSGGKTWNRYPDKWDGEDKYVCEEAQSNAEKGPVRGFGWLWCNRPELQARLGDPREAEAGSGGSPPYAHVQFYQGGVMFYNPLNNEVFVLFDQGDWQRFSW